MIIEKEEEQPKYEKKISYEDYKIIIEESLFGRKIEAIVSHCQESGDREFTIRLDSPGLGIFISKDNLNALYFSLKTILVPHLSSEISRIKKAMKKRCNKQEMKQLGSNHIKADTLLQKLIMVLSSIYSENECEKELIMDILDDYKNIDRIFE